MSDFHPETWSPLWSVGSLLTGIVSFMNTEEATVGSVKASSAERKVLAARSMEYNMKDPTFIAVFGTLPLIHFERNDAILQVKADLRLKSLARRNKAECSKEEAPGTSADMKVDIPSECTSTSEAAVSSHIPAPSERVESKKVQELFSLDLDNLKL